MAIKVTSGKQIRSPRIFLFGSPKSGKSSTAAHAAKPIFIDLENGTANLDCARLDPPPATFEDLLKTIRELGTEKHEFRTLVVDPLSRVEPMIWDLVLAEYNKTTKVKASSVPDIPYGRGADAAVDYWRRLVAALEQLWVAKNMTIILVDHSAIRNFKDPTAVADYQRIEPSIDRKAAGIVRRWCDAVLFADFKVDVMMDPKTKQTRATGVGERVLHTEHGAAHDGGNRYRLPSEMPLDWNRLAVAIREGMSSEQSMPAEQPAPLAAVAQEQIGFTTTAAVAMSTTTTTK